MSIQHKGMIVALVIIASVIASIFVYEKSPSIVDDNENIPLYQSDVITSRVFIKNIHEYSKYFAPERHLSIEQTLHSFTIRSGIEPDLFTGIVRDESLRQSPSSNGNILTKILVDIYPANLTYSLEIESGNEPGGIKPINIVCAPPEQQINPSAKCVSGIGVG